MTGGGAAGAKHQFEPAIDEAERALRAVAGGARGLELAESYRRVLSSWPVDSPYNRVPAEVLAARDTLRREGGASLVAAVHRFVLLASIPAAREALAAQAHLAPVLEWFDSAAAGMAAELAGTPDERLDFPLDPFVKDLAVVLRRLWPLGAVGVDPRVRLRRTWFTEDGARGLLQGAGVLLRLRGTAPLYEIHLYHRHLSEFSEQGWTACYRRIAQIMGAQPWIRGLFGKTWFWDPALERVSPHLAYLRRLPLAHGAILVRVRNGPHTYVNALQKSETRRRLHAAGKYEPQEYVLIWPRRPFLRWAAGA